MLTWVYEFQCVPTVTEVVLRSPVCIHREAFVKRQGSIQVTHLGCVQVESLLAMEWTIVISAKAFGVLRRHKTLNGVSIEDELLPTRIA